MLVAKCPTTLTVNKTNIMVLELNDLLIGWLVNERVELLKCCPSKNVPKKYIHKTKKVVSRS